MSESGANQTLQPVVSKPSTNVWCHSVCETVKINSDWTIHNLAFQISPGFPPQFKTVSAEMSAEEFPDLNWSFELAHPGRLDCPDCTIDILFKNNASSDILLQIKSAVVNKEQQKVYDKEQYFISKAGSSDKLNISHLYYLKIRSENLLSDEGHLTISCEMEALSAIKNSSGQTRNHKAQLQSCNQLNSLNENLGNFYENNILTDVTLLAGEEEFQAHKTILAASSPVFRTMFQQEMKEKFCGEVEVPDVEPDVLEQVLHFIYTGRISATEMEELSYELLAAADKYLLENLKSKCENHLKCQISIETCIEILLLADRHLADNLKKYALNFFRGKMAQVMASDGWKKVKEKELARLFEMLKTVFD